MHFLKPGLKSLKKKTPEAHPMGDFYGTGFKAKVGKLRGDTAGYSPVSKKKLGTPPKNLA